MSDEQQPMRCEPCDRTFNSALLLVEHKTWHQVYVPQRPAPTTDGTSNDD